jgi:hypothetical protein
LYTNSDGELSPTPNDTGMITDPDLMDDINNFNNQSRSFKWTPKTRNKCNTKNDGAMYGFLSPADGPMLSAKAKEQIMVLNFILETMPHQRRILQTPTLVSSFDSDGIMTLLMERVTMTKNEIDIMQGARDDMGNMRVDSIPLDKVCDFRNGEGMLGYVEKSAQLGETLVAPVCVKYEIEGVETSKVFWLVLLKTRRCFDFSGHIGDIVAKEVFAPVGVLLLLFYCV